MELDIGLWGLLIDKNPPGWKESPDHFMGAPQAGQMREAKQHDTVLAPFQDMFNAPFVTRLDFDGAIPTRSACPFCDPRFRLACASVLSAFSIAFAHFSFAAPLPHLHCLSCHHSAT
jgi:hypothetical protein